jgi:hypothetical protein
MRLGFGRARVERVGNCLAPFNFRCECTELGQAELAFGFPVDRAVANRTLSGCLAGAYRLLRP